MYWAQIFGNTCLSSAPQAHEGHLPVTSQRPDYVVDHKMHVAIQDEALEMSPKLPQGQDHET